MQGAFTSFFGPARDARETKGLTTALDTRDTEAGGSGLIRPFVGHKPEGKQRGPDVTRDFGLSGVDRDTSPMYGAVMPLKQNPKSVQFRPESIVFVDRLFKVESKNPQAHFVGRKNGHRWCHMWSEDVELLHVMAAEIGMKRAWFQDKPGFPHYDLTPGKRLQAIRRGAVEMDLKEWLRDRVLNQSKEELR
jgi:hypothetical protein